MLLQVANVFAVSSEARTNLCLKPSNMEEKCPRCNWTIVQLNLSEEQKRAVAGILKQDAKLHAVKYLRENTTLSLTDSKGAMMHWHKTYGQCVRCKHTELTEEYINCPQCNAFNYNLKIVD